MERFDKKVLACFPLAIYLAIGTLLLSVIWQLEKIIEILGNYSEFPALYQFQATEWHNKDFWITFLFPLSWPVLACRVILDLTYAFIAAFLRFVYDIIESIWHWAVDLIESVWDSVRSFFPSNLPEQTRVPRTNREIPQLVKIWLIALGIPVLALCLTTGTIPFWRHISLFQLNINPITSVIPSVPTVKDVKISKTTPTIPGNTAKTIIVTIDTPSPKTLPTTETPTFIILTTVKVDTGYLRAAPNKNSRVVGYVKKEDKLTVYGRNDDGSWLLVQKEPQIWIGALLVDISNTKDNIPYATTSP